MRSGGNFNPEWGYLAPAPSFMRTARIVVVATAIGATAGAAVVLNFVGSGNNPGLQADTGKSLVVVRSLVQPAEAATAATGQPVTPLATAAPVATPSVSPQPVQASAQAPQAVAQPASGSLKPPPPAAQLSAPASSESRAASTSAAPASVAALAEIPLMTDVSPGSSPGQALFTPDQTGAAKLSGKPAVPLSQAPGAQAPAPQTPAHVQPAAAAYPRKKPEQQGFGPLLRHLFSARGGNT
jgi:hypothetical protein